MYVYPPTPAFTKAGAVPGTTAGVEPVFAGLPLPCRSPAPTMPKTLRGSFDQALRPLPSVVKGAQSRLAPDYSAKDRPAREKELGLLLCFVSETKSKNELMHDHHDECWFLMRRSITGNVSLFFSSHRWAEWGCMMILFPLPQPEQSLTIIWRWWWYILMTVSCPWHKTYIYNMS